MELNVALLNFHGETITDLYTIPKNVTLVMYCKTESCPVIFSDLFLFKMATNTDLETKINYLTYMKHHDFYGDLYCVFDSGTIINDMMLYTETNPKKFISGIFQVPIKYKSKLENILEEEELYNLSKSKFVDIETFTYNLEKENNIMLSDVVGRYRSTIGEENDEYLFFVSACRGSDETLDQKYNARYDIDTFVSKLKLEDDEYVVTYDNDKNVVPFKIDRDLLDYYINPKYFSTTLKLQKISPVIYFENFDYEDSVIIVDNVIYNFFNDAQENKLLNYMVNLINTHELIALENEYIMVKNEYNSRIYQIKSPNCECKDITDDITYNWTPIGSIDNSEENDDEIIYVKKDSNIGDILFSVDRQLVSTTYINEKLVSFLTSGDYSKENIDRCFEKCLNDEILNYVYYNV